MSRRKTSLNEIIDYEKLNIDGISKEFKEECFGCNVHEKYLNKIRCKPCPFIFNSTHNHKNEEKKRTRVGCSARFKKYGIIDPEHLGKNQITFFLNNPELNFRMPEFPEFDLFGRPRKDSWKWHIHHMEEFWNDNKWCQLLVLNTEHNQFESESFWK